MDRIAGSLNGRVRRLLASPRPLILARCLAIEEYLRGHIGATLVDDNDVQAGLKAVVENYQLEEGAGLCNMRTAKRNLRCTIDFAAAIPTRIRI